MPWWAWIGVGIALVGVELVAADLAFYFVFIGVAAIVVGVLEAAGAELPPAGQWLTFAVLAVAAMVLFREKLYKRLRGGLPGFDNAVAGAGRVSVAHEVPVGGHTRVALRGTQWDASNVGATAIPAGGGARVVKVEGNVLQIVAEAPAAREAADQSAGDSVKEQP